MLLEAIDLTDPTSHEELGRRRVDAARSLLTLDRAREALERAEGVAVAPVSDTTRRAALEICSYAALEVSGPEEAARYATEALGLTEDPHQAVDIGERYADLLWPLGRQAELDRTLRWVLRKARTSRDPDLVARATVSLVAGEFVFGKRTARSALRAIERASADLPDEPFPMRVHVKLAQVAQWADDPNRAQANWRAVIEDATRTGNELVRLQFLCYSADLHVRTGEWEQAERAASEGTEEAVAGEAPRISSHAHSVLALAAAARGDLDRARRAARRGLVLAGDYPWLRARNLAALGIVESACGNRAGAADLLGQAAGADPPLLLWRHGACHIAVDLIEAKAAGGVIGDAEAALEVIEGQAARWGDGWVVAAAARSRALVASAQGDLAVALASAERAVALHQRLPYPLEHGRSLLSAGSIHRRMRHLREARAVLERARHIFLELGAAAWKKRTEVELARIGGRAPSHDELTSSERAVAELVGRGLSNAEIGRELVLTIRTVESHLTHVYAKLGVRTRTELVRDLLTGPAPRS